MYKKISLALLCACVILSGIAFFGFRSHDDSGNLIYMEVTTVESIIPGGLGRSKMIVTDEKGTITETNLENLYSMVGINFGNITGNDQKVVTKINELSGKGWKLDHVASGVQSPTDSGKQGIYLTRYIFRKSA